MSRINPDWPYGEWDHEPDEKLWVSSGYACYARRNCEMGSWCGYVQLPENHKDYARTDDEEWGDILEQADFSVHGGITYSEEGRIGFDCSHYGDAVPGLLQYNPACRGQTYRNLAFVVSETNRLAEFLFSREKPELIEEVE